MPAYANIDQFMNKVDTANPSFTLSRSSLRDLIRVLRDVNGTSAQAETALRKIPNAKASKYAEALLYLRTTLPGLSHIALPGGLNLGKTNAVLLKKTDLPSRYNHDFSGANKKDLYNGPNKFQMVEPETRFLGTSVEQFIWEFHGKLGVILIHMGKEVPGMELVMNGKTVIEHIKSVLEIAVKKNANILALHLYENTPVCEPLQNVYARFGNRKAVFEPNKHEGGDNPYFKAFTEAHPLCVVIGWDADVCAASNVLGGASLDENNRLIEPIVTRTNVVTSRALLVTTGQIQKPQWGVLAGT